MAITRRTEFDVLKASHKFLRDDDEQASTWDDQLAQKYYDSLYREFAVCDLKHYKSGNFALRWRTEDEVLSGAGETTCGNTRCAFHAEPDRGSGISIPPLTTLELPFVYEEHGETKTALVKVVLCGRCCNKLMWKRDREKVKKVQTTGSPEPPVGSSHAAYTSSDHRTDRKRKRQHGEEDNRQARTRSGSPRRRSNDDKKRR